MHSTLLLPLKVPRYSFSQFGKFHRIRFLTQLRTKLKLGGCVFCFSASGYFLQKTFKMKRYVKFHQTLPSFMGNKWQLNWTFSYSFSERTLSLTNPIPRYLLVNLLNYVIETKDWNKLKVLYLGGGGPSSLPVGVGGLATNIDIVNVPLGEVIRHLGLKDPLLISVLIGHGASVNLIGGSDVIPLNEAMNKERLPLVEMLVQKGANCCATDNEGEPIIHKALRKGLSSGNCFGLISLLLQYLCLHSILTGQFI